MLLYNNIAHQKAHAIQANKKARDEVKDTIKYLDEMLRSVSDEIKLLQEGGSPTDASTRPLVRLQQMGDEFVRSVSLFGLVKNMRTDFCYHQSPRGFERWFEQDLWEDWVPGKDKETIPEQGYSGSYQ